MTLWLKQSTAKVVSFGPFLDKADGVTEETGLVSALDHASTGIKLSKNGGALTIRHATVTATTYDAYGMYLVTLDTTDTNTVGTLRMAFNEAATCLPVWQDFMVLPANVYDSLVGGTDALDVSAIQFAGQTITASGGVTIPAATLASTTNITAGTIATVTTLTNLPAATTDWLTAAAVKADAVTKIQNGLATPTNITAATGITVATNNDKTGYSLTATTGLGNQTANITGNLSGSVGSVTGLAAANLDVAVSSRLATVGYTAPLDAAGTRTAVGLATANLDTQLAAELAQATLARKILKNRTETDPATGVMTVYDDDGTTPLYTANLYTDVAGATAYDGTAGVNRRNALA